MVVVVTVRGGKFPSTDWFWFGCDEIEGNIFQIFSWDIIL